MIVDNEDETSGDEPARINAKRRRYVHLLFSTLKLVLFSRVNAEVLFLSVINSCFHLKCYMYGCTTHHRHSYYGRF